MAVVDVDILAESQSRYLTYALSVVNSRALPDVRDGLKPVQRRILYAMFQNLHLRPTANYRKSAAVVGEVLARFHPHGDAACYEAMVRMAQPFSLRYPLVDGQGNFGSLDGDGAAAYRYTEARLTPFALEVIGDIGQETVAERQNFDQTLTEPVVLPSRVPNLLVNGTSGIAVGMATAIPPHNLTEVIKALLLLLEDEEVTDSKILSIIHGPDFPTACAIANSKKELAEIYRTGRGAIRMRATYEVELAKRGKTLLIVTSIPYALDKSVIVEKIADLIIAKKLPQVSDVRDESTDDVRIVLELAAGADAEKVMSYLFKYTTLESNFNVNLTALMPTSNPHSGAPVQVSLRQMLESFVTFRVEVTRAKLLYEKKKLDERIHLLEGLRLIIDVIPEVIKLVRKSKGRADAAEKLMERFKLSELQALFIVDLRIYQLSATSIDEVLAELKEKVARVKEIERIVASAKALKKEVGTDLQRIVSEFGDKRRSQIVHDAISVSVDEEAFVAHEDVKVIVTRDGWLKRIGKGGDLETTRMREGDRLLFGADASTRDSLVLFSNFGNAFGLRVMDLPATSGYGEPVQKLLRFADGEQIVAARVVSQGEVIGEQFFYTKRGFGFRAAGELLGDLTKRGKRLVRVSEGDLLKGVVTAKGDLVCTITANGYSVLFKRDEAPTLTGPGKGVIIQRIGDDDEIVGACVIPVGGKFLVEVENGGEREVSLGDLEITGRAKRGQKAVKRGLPVVGFLGVKQ